MSARQHGLRRTAALVAAAVALTLASCGEDESSSTTPSEPPTGTGSAPSAATPSPARPSEAPSEAPPDARPPRVRLALAAHLERAELFRGATRVMQLGEAAGHQHTLGGWRTRTGDTATEEGARAAAVGHVTGFFVVPIDAPGRCRVRLRARGVADRRLALYLDDHPIGDVTVPTDGSYATVEARVPDDRCAAGEHELRLRSPSTGAVPGVGRASALVDWITIGPDDAPPIEAPIDPAVDVDGRPGLRIAGGWTVAYPLEVPAGARLRGHVAGDGALRVRVSSDGQPDVDLGVTRAGAFDLDLAAHAGRVVRLSLVAEGAVTVADPAIVTLDGPRDGAAPRERPRLRSAIFYLTDTLRADHLTVYAPDTRVQTPSLTAWSAEAAIFERGHSQENWTKPSCATLLSGLYPWEHNATSEDAVVPASVELISETLRARGFRTGAFISNGFVSDRFGFDQGWGTFHNYLRLGRRNMARYVAEDVTAWLEEQPPGEPFFLYVHTIDPHVPYIPPDEDLARYDPEPYEGVVDFREDRELLEKVKSGRISLGPRDRAHLEALYDGEVTYHDRYFGEMMRALEARGLADETLVVFTADHGEEFWDHDSVGHGHSVFEELIRVPLIVRWPGLTDPGARIDEAVGLVDVVPTALEALGVEPPDGLSGRSLAPLLAGETEDAPRATVTGFMNGWRTVVIGRYKLIQRTPARYMVYDLEEDPGETRDLAAERPITVRYLRAMLGLTLAGASGAHEGERAPIDDELRRQLEAIGYVGASRAPQVEDDP